MLIDFGIRSPDTLRQILLAALVSVQHIAQARRHQFAHTLYRARQDGHGFGFGDHYGALRYVFGQIADTLQRIGELHSGNGLAQVFSHRLTKGDHADALALDILFQFVELDIALDDALRQSHVTACHSFDRVGNLGFGNAAH